MMQRAMKDDAELLREYVERHSDTAFAELVGRHVNLVYSTALRMVRDNTLAEDVVQSVFVQLARKAPGIREGNALGGWLYRVTHCQAANAVRAEHTRRRHEAEAMMQAELEADAAWIHIESGLEEAMAMLNPDEQDLLVLRFFQDRTWRDVSAALALSEETVQRRVGRALEKLRAFFARKGVAVSASVIGMAVAANAVQTAPAGLASAVAGVSLVQAAGAASSGALPFLKALFMKKTAVAWLAGALVVGVSVPVLIATMRDRPITAEALRNGLVLHFTFDRDETGDNQVTDASDRGNHGKATGVRWTAEGKRGGAYEFTADGHEIVVPNNESLNPEHLTLSAWIKTSTGDHYWRRIFDKSYSQGFALSVAGDWQQKKWYGQLCVEIGPGTHVAMTKLRVDDGQWHHVVTTFDGTAELIYVDGQLQGQFHWNKPSRVGATGFNLVIGCNRSNLDNTEDDLGISFRGLIDEPMMWNRALSEQEVAFLYESQNRPPAGPVAVN
jgi:RNA polymerase sigma factor (sigma-70 family)